MMMMKMVIKMIIVMTMMIMVVMMITGDDDDDYMSNNSNNDNTPYPHLLPPHPHLPTPSPVIDNSLVVKVSIWKAVGPGFDSRSCCVDFSGSSHASDLKIATPVTTMPGAW